MVLTFKYTFSIEHVLVISVGTPRIEDVLLTAEAVQVSSETRRRELVQTEVCATLEEGIVNVKAIDPAYGAGPPTITCGGGRRDSRRRSQSGDAGRVSSRLR
jgi:hypothetical protein